MRFKVVPFQDGSQRDDAVLTGIAGGFGELYPVPDHPHGVQRLLSSASKSREEAMGPQGLGQVQRFKARVGQRE